MSRHILHTIAGSFREICRKSPFIVLGGGASQSQSLLDSLTALLPDLARWLGPAFKRNELVPVPVTPGKSMRTQGNWRMDQPMSGSDASPRRSGGCRSRCVSGKRRSS